MIAYCLGVVALQFGGELGLNPDGPGGAVRCVGFRPNGDLVSVCGDGTVRVTTPGGESRLYRVPGRTGSVRTSTAAMSADGRWLAVGVELNGNYNRPVHLVELAAGMKLSPWVTYHDRVLTAVALLHRGGRMIVVTADEQGAIAFTEPRGAVEQTLVHSGPIRSLAVAPDGGSLVAGDDAGETLFMALSHAPENALPRRTSVVSLRGLKGPVVSAAFSPSGKLFAAAAEDRVLVWDNPPKAAPVADFRVGGAVGAVQFKGDDELLVARDGGVDARGFGKGAAARVVLRRPGRMSAVALSSDLARLAVGDQTGKALCTASAADGSGVVSLGGRGGPTATPRWTPDGAKWVWDEGGAGTESVKRGFDLTSLAPFDAPAPALAPAAGPDEVPPLSAAWRVPGETPEVKPSGRVERTPQNLLLLARPRDAAAVPIDAPGFSSATGWAWLDAEVLLLTYERMPYLQGKVGYNTYPLIGHTAPVSGTSVSPHGRFVATTSTDRTVRVWNWKSNHYGSQYPPVVSVYRDGADWAAWTAGGLWTASAGGRARLGRWESTPESLDRFRPLSALETDRGDDLRVALPLLLGEKPDWDEYVSKFVARDLAAAGPEEARNRRYVSFAHLLFAGSYHDYVRASAESVLPFVLASLSWGTGLPRPGAIDPFGVVFRVRLDEYADRTGPWGPGWWDAAVRGYPYRTKPVGPGHPTGSSEPWVRGDWFISAVTTAPRYYDLLGMPRTARGIEDLVGVDAAANRVVPGPVRAAARSLALRSDVSPNPRLLERHTIPRERHYANWPAAPAPRPAYWLTFDFADAVGERNVLARPLGPGRGPDQFRHDGGEIMFHLPNGLFAYAVVDRDGVRWNLSPIEASADHEGAAFQRDPVFVTAHRCMGCHASHRGVTSTPDALRPHVTGGGGGFAAGVAAEVLRLHPRPAVMSALAAADNAAFRRAWKTYAVNDAPPSPDSFAGRFSAVRGDELSLEAAAVELGATPAGVLAALTTAPDDVRMSLGSLSLPDGRVRRKVFDELFPRLVRAIRGEPDEVAAEPIAAPRRVPPPAVAPAPAPAPEPGPAPTRPTAPLVWAFAGGAACATVAMFLLRRRPA